MSEQSENTNKSKNEHSKDAFMIPGAKGWLSTVGHDSLSPGQV